MLQGKDLHGEIVKRGREFPLDVRSCKKRNIFRCFVFCLSSCQSRISGVRSRRPYRSEAGGVSRRLCRFRACRRRGRPLMDSWKPDGTPFSYPPLNAPTAGSFASRLSFQASLFPGGDQMLHPLLFFRCRFIASKVSSLRSCSILQASLAAISRSTPIAMSISVRT